MNRRWKGFLFNWLRRWEYIQTETQKWLAKVTPAYVHVDKVYRQVTFPFTYETHRTHHS